jgi:hypothetical protein
LSFFKKIFQPDADVSIILFLKNFQRETNFFSKLPTMSSPAQKREREEEECTKNKKEFRCWCCQKHQNEFNQKKSEAISKGLSWLPMANEQEMKSFVDEIAKIDEFACGTILMTLRKLKDDIVARKGDF